MDDLPVHTTPAHQTTTLLKWMFNQKLFFTLAAKLVVKHSIQLQYIPSKQLPSLLSNTSSMLSKSLKRSVQRWSNVELVTMFEIEHYSITMSTQNISKLAITRWNRNIKAYLHHNQNCSKPSAPPPGVVEGTGRQMLKVFSDNAQSHNNVKLLNFPPLNSPATSCMKQESIINQASKKVFVFHRSRL